MTIRDDKWRLMETKEHLSHALEELDLAYNKGMINKLEYLDKRYNLLGGRQEESIIEDINYELREIRNKQTTRSKLAMGAFLLVLLIGTGMFTGFFNINFEEFGFTSPTGFATASTPLTPVTMNIGENYTDNTTKDLSFMSTTSLKASGKIYGSGQAWIYLDDGVTRKLVLYADTRSSIGITGFTIANPGNSGNAGIGFTLVNNTNITTTGTTTHSETITGLQDGQSYTRYIRCQDNSGNSNPTSLQIDFNILTPGQTPPPPTGADIFLDFNDPTNLGVTCGSNNPCVWPWRKHDYWPTGGVSGSGAINMHWSPNMVVGSSPVYVRTGSTARHFRISYRVKQSAIMSTSGSRQKVMRLWSDNPFRAVGMLENTRGNLCWHWEGWDTRPLSSCVGIGQGTFNDNQWHTYTIEVDYRNTADFVVTLSFDGVVVRTLHLDASAAGNLYNGLLIVSPMVEMFSCGVVSGPCGAGNPTVAGDYTVDDFTFTVLP